MLIVLLDNVMHNSHIWLLTKCVCISEQLKSHENFLKEEEKAKLQKYEKVYHMKLSCGINKCSIHM